MTKWNWNVVLTLVLKASDGIALGIWSLSVLSTYIVLLEGDDDAATEVCAFA